MRIFSPVNTMAKIEIFEFIFGEYKTYPFIKDWKIQNE
jgi:hypothetical protein